MAALDGSATLPLGAAAGTRKCRVPVSCLLAALVLEGGGRCEGGQPSALPSLTLPTGGWRGGAGRERKDSNIHSLGSITKEPISLPSSRHTGPPSAPEDSQL